MYSGLLPSGLTEADLSSDDDDEGETAEKTDEHQSHQLSIEPHSASVQVKCNKTKSDDALGDDCLPGVSLDKWQVRELTSIHSSLFLMYAYELLI